jgi:Mrp family chromosome partitioning ATPase
VEISAIFEAIRRRLLVVGVFGLLGIVGGYLNTSGTPMYRGVAVLTISAPTASGINVAQTDRYITGEVTLIGSGQILEAAVKSTGGKITGRDYAERLEVEQRPESDLVEIRFSSPSAELAASGANAVADAYLAFSKAQQDSQLKGKLEVIDAELAATKKEFDEVAAQINEKVRVAAGSAAGAAQIDATLVAPDLVFRRDQLSAENLRLLNAKGELAQLADSGPSASLVERVTPPSEPEGTSRKIALGLGGLLGVSLGVLVSLAMAQFSGRVVTTDEIQSRLGVPVLGSVKRGKDSSDASRRILESEQVKSDGLIEQVCVIAEASSDTHTPTVAVTTVSGTGSAGIALRMARQLSVQGQSVLLIDADAHGSALSSTLGDSNAAVIESSTDFQSLPKAACVATGNPRISFLSLGTGEPGQALRREAIAELLVGLGDKADVLIFDLGVLMGSAFGVHLTRAVDVVVIGIPATGCEDRELDEAGEQLDKTQARLVGVTLS